MNMSAVLEKAISVIKPMLLSVGLISTITLLKVAIFPKLTNLVIRFWVSLSFLLSPPYVFIIFNFIIIAIAASSSSIFRHPPQPHTSSHQHQHEDEDTTAASDHNSATSKIVLLAVEEDEEEEKGKLVKWDLSTLSTGNVDDPGNFCAYSSGEKVEEEVADGDSMEDTWQAIMEKKGKEKPKLKKSETWDSPRRLIRADGDGDDTVARVKKSNYSFKETMSFKRKKSMGHEELKRRAEAFIEMVNTSMRLQRQESEQRFLQLQKHKRSV